MSATSYSSARDSYQKLAASQKSATGAPLYSVLINRPLGRIFAALAHQIGLTPNQVTLVSAVFTFSGIAVLAIAPPTWLTALLVTAGLVLGYGLDSADGQLARLRGGGTLTGEWLDHFIDSIKVASLHLGVLVMFYNYFKLTNWWLLVPLIFSITSVAHFFGMLLTDLLTRTRSGNSAKRTSGSRLVSAAKLPTDYGVLCLSMLLLPLTGFFVWWYTFLAVAMLGYTALVVPVWYRRIARLEVDG